MRKGSINFGEEKKNITFKERVPVLPFCVRNFRLRPAIGDNTLVSKEKDNLSQESFDKLDKARTPQDMDGTLTLIFA